MDEIINSLINIGLSPKEANTYIALLKIGSGSAYKVAQKSGIKKPTTYVILEELRQKGMVLKMPSTKNTIYKAQEPIDLFRHVEENLNRSRQAIPQLLAIKNKERSLKTFYYEGIKGIKDALYYGSGTHNSSELVGFYAKAENMSKEYEDQLKLWTEKMKREGINFRVVVPDHESLNKYRLEDKDYNREVKVIPHDQYSSEVSLDTDGEFVRIIDLRDLQAVVIDNPRVAKTLKEIFEMVWNS